MVVMVRVVVVMIVVLLISNDKSGSWDESIIQYFPIFGHKKTNGTTDRRTDERTNPLLEYRTHLKRCLIYAMSIQGVIQSYALFVQNFKSTC